jgi:patatin-related protein
VKEKELRIALVCYGGVSLAVYMHGVTKELWKLVRASHALHTRRQGRQEAASSTAGKHRFADGSDKRPFDTEAIYFDLLQDLSPQLSLRVIIDVATGASAGGINAIMLARALAHDLSLEPLTDLWLENTDVTKLLNISSRAGRWSKWFLRPFLWLALSRMTRLAPEKETREKLSLFVRSRWFKPPFDGRRLMEFLLDAASAMGNDGGAKGKPGLASLLPRGLPLTLHVTTTDFHGYTTRIPAHDPPQILEREHRHSFAFRYLRQGDGQVESDFAADNLPGLVFAARASSSYPGAFPAAQLRQIDRLLQDRGQDWPGRARFIERNFSEYHRHGADPELSGFIDGSVLNNKPFAAALAAIAGRPAYREVDRRFVYIDPNPAIQDNGANRDGKARSLDMPGFFRTIKGALSDIPRNEPVRGELTAIAGRNARIDKLRGLLEAARPRIAAEVAQVIGGPLPDAPSIEDVKRWRDAAGAHAASQAGFAYEAYLRLKIDGALDMLAGLLAPCLGDDAEQGRTTMRLALGQWARTRQIMPDHATETGTPGARPAWVRFLRDFDIAFRARRLRFLIRELNAIYPEVGKGQHADTNPRDLDEMKASLYGALERLPGREGLGIFNAGERMALCKSLKAAGGGVSQEALDSVLPKLAALWGLETQSAEVDEIFSLIGLNYLGPAARRIIFEAYIGFSFWDVLTFSTSGWGELDEFHAIKVDRIAPPDAQILRAAGAPVQLRSARLNAFGGFFSRHDREHDYLLGRLHAAERAIDLVVDAAGDPADQDSARDPARIRRIKIRAFRTILEVEAERLGSDCPALRQIRGWVDLCEAGIGA